MEAEKESQLLLPSYDAAGSDRTGLVHASSLFGTVMRVTLNWFILMMNFDRK